MEKFNPKNLRRGLVGCGLTALLLTGCGAYNYSGNGNEFTVTGEVTDPGDESLKVRIHEVVDADGKAKGWFKPEHVHQIHDNCDCHGTWHGRKQYGEVHDVDGSVIEPAHVAVGACVVVEGKIRTDQDGKYTSTRPVYDVAQLVDC
jgi:hypothetical protein